MQLSPYLDQRNILFLFFYFFIPYTLETVYQFPSPLTSPPCPLSAFWFISRPLLTEQQLGLSFVCWCDCTRLSEQLVFE